MSDTAPVTTEAPGAEHTKLDIHDIMSGIGMPYFQANGAVLVGPLPWMALAVIVLIVFCLFGLAGRITEHQDF